EDKGTAEHFVNQYLIRQELGRGSFGAVHLAVDQYGREYAVKEFSKSRLRKRAQSQFLRHPRRSSPERERDGYGAAARAASAGVGFNEPLHRNPSHADAMRPGSQDPLYLIRHEIAVMKKLQHHNLVSLFEVLDDPTEDSLYMVMELCKQGVVMRVGLGVQAEPYDDERCRHCFRDLLLGIEYLHAQGIVHRDIKPDNCLLTSGGVLKVVDFGVSEMFTKESEMYTAKFAGSPAFLPPELCVAGHGDVSGKAADIWSMGVTLYCLKFGRLPFEKPNVLDLYESIRHDDLRLPPGTDPDLADLMQKILAKDPDQRINMPTLREHPWVTRQGIDPLMSEAENTAIIIPTPTDEEVSRAITKSMRHVLALVKAVQRFKKLIEDPEEHTQGSILGSQQSGQLVQPPEMMDDEEQLQFPASRNDSRSLGGAFDGSRMYPVRPDDRSKPQPQSPESHEGSDEQARSQAEDTDEQAQARRILDEIMTERERILNSQDQWATSTWLFVGPSNRLEENQPRDDDYFSCRQRQRLPDSTSTDAGCAETHVQQEAQTDRTDDFDPATAGPDQEFCLSESPSAADDDIYESAYRAEIERIRRQYRKPAPTVYLTRRVEDKPTSEALLRQAHDEGAVVSAPSNARRTSLLPSQALVSGSPADRAKLAISERRATGVNAPLRGKRASMAGDRLKGALQKIRKGPQ
ncbi:hypothetical protein KEM52_005589, partial [Ascosphaera acerosa]